MNDIYDAVEECLHGRSVEDPVLHHCAEEVVHAQQDEPTEIEDDPVFHLLERWGL